MRSKVEHERRCDISDLPQWMCADCLHNTHGVAGRHLSISEVRDGLDELVDTRVELGVSVKASPQLIVVEAEANTICTWDDCVRRIRVGDQIAKHSDYAELGFVHADHYET